jgi:hypothetical protein
MIRGATPGKRSRAHWARVKYEDVYVRGYDAAPPLGERLCRYFPFNDEERLH